MKKKYRYKYKSPSKEVENKPKVAKTNVSVRLRVLLLLVWGIIAIGIYAALSKVSFLWPLRLFVFLLVVSFIAYFIISVRVGKYIREDKGDTEMCRRLIDIGKMLLIFMIPSVFIIIYDFIVTTYKMFM